MALIEPLVFPQSPKTPDSALALTLLLLSAAGAAIQGFVRMMRVNLGYNPHNAMAIGIPVHENTFPTRIQRANYFTQLRDKIATQPDVISTGISTNATPPDNGWKQSFELRGKTASESQKASVNLVDSRYLHTLTMTSNTAPSGTVSASSSFSGNPPWWSFASPHDGWVSNATSTGWLQYQFPSAVTITSYVITPWSVNTFPTRSPTAWTLQGSNDGTTFTNLDTRSFTSWVVSVGQPLFCSDPGVLSLLPAQHYSERRRYICRS
jgi:hypothetical protein